MRQEGALKIIAWICFFGMLFSAYLSWFEVTKNVCIIGGCSSILNIPACVYGFALYLAVFIISLMGLRGTKKRK